MPKRQLAAITGQPIPNVQGAADDSLSPSKSSPRNTVQQFSCICKASGDRVEYCCARQKQSVVKGVLDISDIFVLDKKY